MLIGPRLRLLCRNRGGGEHDYESGEATYHPQIGLIYLVAEHDERKVVGVGNIRLHEELVPPVFQILKGLCNRNVKY